MAPDLRRLGVLRRPLARCADHRDSLSRFTTKEDWLIGNDGEVAVKRELQVLKRRGIRMVRDQLGCRLGVVASVPCKPQQDR